MSENAAPNLNSVLGQSGACPEIELNGETWKIGHPTQQAKSILNLLIVANATAELTALRGVVDAQTYADSMREHSARVANGYYKTWRDGWLAAMGDKFRADAVFLQSLLRVNHPGATEKLARDLYEQKPDEVSMALLEIAPPFFEMLVKELPAKTTPEQRAECMKMLRDVILEKYQSPQGAST